MIAMVNHRGFTSEYRHRVTHTSLELIIIVRVEQIVFTIVLVLNHYFDLAETSFESRECGFAEVALAITITTPIDIGLRQIRPNRPGPFVT